MSVINGHLILAVPMYSVEYLHTAEKSKSNKIGLFSFQTA